MSRAFSILELVLAIVVLGVSLAALPYIVSMSSKGISSFIVQEAVSTTKSKLSEILTYPWNSNMIDQTDSYYPGKLIICDDRKKEYLTYSNRGCMLRDRDNSKIAANNTSNKAKNGINEFNGVVNNDIKITDNASEKKNILNIKGKSSVSFCNISINPNSQGIETFFSNTCGGNTKDDALLVSYEVYDGANFNDSEVRIKLNAYSFNIGAMKAVRDK